MRPTDQTSSATRARLGLGGASPRLGQRRAHPPASASTLGILSPPKSSEQRNFVTEPADHQDLQGLDP